MKQDDFLKQVTSKLDGLAQHHKDKPVVMNHVLEHIQDAQHSRFAFLKCLALLWLLRLLAVVLPNIVSHNEPQTQAVSPQTLPTDA